VIDTSTNTVTKTIAGFNQPWGVAVSPDGNSVYVTNLGENGTVSVIDTTTNTVVGDPITVGTGGPQGVAVTPDGKSVYITSSDGNAVWVIDTTTNQGTSVGGGDLFGAPWGVAVSHDGKSVYVTNQDAGTVSVIGTITTIKGFNRTVGVAVSPAVVELSSAYTRAAKSRKATRNPASRWIGPEHRYLKVKAKNGPVAHVTKVTGVIKIAGQRFRLAPRWVKLQAGEGKVVKVRFKGHKRAVKQIRELLTDTPGRARVLIRASSVGNAPPITDNHWVRLQR
jgi:YVTN family beta-propeller protein